MTEKLVSIEPSTIETIDIRDQIAGVYVLFINGKSFKIVKE